MRHVYKILAIISIIAMLIAGLFLFNLFSEIFFESYFFVFFVIIIFAYYLYKYSNKKYQLLKTSEAINFFNSYVSPQTCPISYEIIVERDSRRNLIDKIRDTKKANWQYIIDQFEEERKREIERFIYSYITPQICPTLHSKFLANDSFLKIIVDKMKKFDYEKWGYIIDSLENRAREVIREEEINNNEKESMIKEIEQKIDSLDPESFPCLIEWRRANRNRLIEVVLNEMESAQDDSIGMILVRYESDLEHLSPSQS